MINTVKNNNKISTNYLQTIQITVRLRRQYICTPCWSCVSAQVHMFIYRPYRPIYKFHGHLIPSNNKPVVAEWRERWTCNLEAVRDVASSNPTVERFNCNVRLVRFPRSWTGSVQIKSSMTFIRGNRCIERER